ncbi:hypothetical protein P1J78_19130, partial [Psychromarinibacter sp. C21-152]
MDKTWIIAAVVVAAGVGGYAYYQTQQDVETPADVSAEMQGEVAEPGELTVEAAEENGAGETADESGGEGAAEEMAATEETGESEEMAAAEETGESEEMAAAEETETTGETEEMAAAEETE